jgi:predicted nucleic acid-binding protein
MRILVDTNVLLRFFDLSHAHQAIADQAFEQLRKLGHLLVIVPQIEYEFWVVATRPVSNNGMGMNIVEAADALRRMRLITRLLRDERAIARYWLDLVVQFEVKGKQAHDARLAAAMQRHGIAHLLTFNAADFSRYPFVTICSPVALASGAAVP